MKVPMISFVSEIRKRARLLYAVAGVCVALGALFFFAARATFFMYHPALSILRPSPMNIQTGGVSKKLAHRYGNSSLSIGTVKITVVYFVPRNSVADPGALPAITAALEQLKKFHEIQFNGSSRLEYAVLPFPVIGKEQDGYYEIDDRQNLTTQERTTEKLNRISDELEEHGFIQKADFTAAYPVELIFYEGVGAGGGLAIDESDYALGGAIIARQFLTDPQYFYGNAFAAHEFYHALGLLDAYDIKSTSAELFSNDLMGGGRYRPLEAGYLEEETLHAMGVE